MEQVVTDRLCEPEPRPSALTFVSFDTAARWLRRRRRFAGAALGVGAIGFEVAENNLSN